MKQVKESLWSKLNDTTATILEFVDITRENLELIIGEEFKTRFHRGIVTDKVAEEILWYQNTDEACNDDGNKVYFATREGNKILITFLRTAF